MLNKITIIVISLFVFSSSYAEEAPYFVALRSNKVNCRTGPAKRYPIKWVYLKKNLPLEVIDKFEHWRKVRDYKKDSCWIHKSLLKNSRFVITAKEATAYDEPTPFSTPLFKMEEKVLGSVIKCKQSWCRININENTGWVAKDDIWGIYPEEIIED